MKTVPTNRFIGCSSRNRETTRKPARQYARCRASGGSATKGEAQRSRRRNTQGRGTQYERRRNTQGEAMQEERQRFGESASRPHPGSRGEFPTDASDRMTSGAHQRTLAPAEAGAQRAAPGRHRGFHANAGERETQNLTVPRGVLQ